ncbi:hypothetical protein PF008_g31914 [Phytophthora fragariae]|uniref:Uncharacterized protein n=1 Tax=Phytophthora fragariae TaxID=53985 RepID=A0A6G0Q1D0_9STRA|nr:hypothetical protein PF008_g31914 [Phytophthora fragariae]
MAVVTSTVQVNDTAVRRRKRSPWGGANDTTEKIDTAEVKNAAVVEDMVGVKNTADMAEAKGTGVVNDTAGVKDLAGWTKEWRRTACRW